MQHNFNFFLLSVFPVVELILKFLPKKVLIFPLVISTLLLLPMLFGYISLVNYLYEISAIVLLACLYSFITKPIKKIGHRIIMDCLLSAGLFGVFYISAFIYCFAFGHLFDKQEYVRNFYNVDKSYRVEYVEEADYRRQTMSYRLEKYSFIPIYFKEIERVIENDSLKGCGICFRNNNLLFDRCAGNFVVNSKDLTIPDDVGPNTYVADETGTSTTFYSNGKIKSEKKDVHGIVVMKKEYYESGKLKSLTTYNVNGVKGKKTTYDENGNEIKQ